MAKKTSKVKIIANQTPKKLYRILQPGECPYCGKGPIAVVVMDNYPLVIDKEGYAMILGDTKTNTYGICASCGKRLGEFEQHLFKWYPVNHPYKDLSLEETKVVKPSYNFFGNKEEQLGGMQEWIIQT